MKSKYYDQQKQYRNTPRGKEIMHKVNTNSFYKLKYKVTLHYSKRGSKFPGCVGYDKRKGCPFNCSQIKDPLHMRALSIDHINGGGVKHRIEVGSGTTFYRWLVNNNYPKGYQPLCLNCQFVKRAILREDSYQSKRL